ncbi:MAG: hypothetical protein Q7T71_16750, partial [Herbiconiux sp.]|nr:hypothetical protein [Herbiconiux sp.]
MPRFIRSFTVLAGVVALTAGLVAPTSAGAEELPAGGAALDLSGVLRVVPVEAPPRVVDESSAAVGGGAVAPSDGGDAAAAIGSRFTLFDEQGAPVDITGDLGGLASGDRVTVTATVPDAVLEQLSAEARADLDDSSDTSPDTRQEVATAADATRTALPVALVASTPSAAAAEADAAEAAEGAAAGKAHRLNVAVMTTPQESSTSVFSTATLDRMVTSLRSFWMRESGGQITGIDATGGYQRFETTSCDPDVAWAKAASLFGSTEQSYFDGSRATPTHLVVIASPTCEAGTGLGTIGGGIHQGGEIWGSVEPGLSERQV